GVPSGRRVPGGQTCLNIVVDGRIVKIFNAAGGNNILTPEYLDVSPFVGKIAVIIIVDNCMAPWGHILVDQIVQTDNPYTPPPAALPVMTISPGYGLATQASAVPAQSAFAPVQPSAEPAQRMTRMQVREMQLQARQQANAAEQVQNQQYAPQALPPTRGLPTTAALAPGGSAQLRLDEFSHALDVQLADKLGASKLFS